MRVLGSGSALKIGLEEVGLNWKAHDRLLVDCFGLLISNEDAEVES